MKVNVFKTKCPVGTKVQNIMTEEVGIVKKISNDRTQALVEFPSEKGWFSCYELEIVNAIL